MPSPPVAVEAGVAAAAVGAEAVAGAGAGVEAVEVAGVAVVVAEVVGVEVVVLQEVPQVRALVETPAPAARARVVQDREIPVIRAVQEPTLHPQAATTLRAPKETKEKVTPAPQAMPAAAGVQADLADLVDLADLADQADRVAQEPAFQVRRLPHSEARLARASRSTPGRCGSALRVRHSGR
jgi:hypothetical protein